MTVKVSFTKPASLEEALYSAKFAREELTRMKHHDVTAAIVAALDPLTSKPNGLYAVRLTRRTTPHVD